MCGIAGFWGDGSSNHSSGMSILERMTDCLVPRGPDDKGYWSDPTAGIFLGHRRLSVIDLSALGRQPMTGPGHRHVLCFNGEIYNHRQLRSELEDSGARFFGTSDTETLVHAFAHWGIARTLRRSRGMFAISLWDRVEQCLVLARDRFGEKPLIYGILGSEVIFGSTLSALRKHPLCPTTWDPQAVSGYFEFGYVPGARSIYRDLYKVPPGSYLVLRRYSDGAIKSQVSRFWNPKDAVCNAASPVLWSDGEAIVEGRRLLHRAVNEQVIADVPVGAFLSGGIDSTLVVAALQEQCRSPIKTFTVGFDDPNYDEAPYARQVASYLGTDHMELRLSGPDVLEAATRMSSVYDEPFADPSQIPTYLVSALARRHVTVALSGDGGDELFCGYPVFHKILRLWRNRALFPPPARLALGSLIRRLGPARADRLIGPAAAAILGESWRANTGRRLHKFGQLLADRSPLPLYERLIRRDFRALRPRFIEQIDQINYECPSEWSPISQITYRHVIGYLPDCILTKVDRAAMAVSLESRIPLLDQDFAEFSLGLPDRFKVRMRRSKWLLREMLYRYVPPAMVDRPKKGFSIPLDAWLRGALRPWAEELLSPAAVRRSGVLQEQTVEALWRDHIRGSANLGGLIWDVLMFQAWAQHQAS